MIDLSSIDYSALDAPGILMFVFHPRREWTLSESFSHGTDVLIPVEKDVAVGGRFHTTDKAAPTILFFHGNGEIVQDYDDLAAIYNRMGINFLPVDYRGYGRSTGVPTITGMMRDAHVIFDFVKNRLKDDGYNGPLIVMGRSLGSASALEIAANYGKEIDGLIIESGFAYAGPLLELLGANPRRIGFREEQGFRNLDKIKTFDKPTLVIHAERDHIIPYSDGKALFDAAGARDKTLLKIPNANHNDIFARGLSEYMAAVKTLAEGIKRSKAEAPVR